MLTPQELIVKYKIDQKVFTAQSGFKLPFCRGMFHMELNTPMATLLFLHGAGERGTDNLLQLVHGAPQLFNYLENHSIKAQVIFPQCPRERQWVDTPWGEKEHDMKATPTPELQAAMELLQTEINRPDCDGNRVYVSGVSMGGYGAWELLSRQPQWFAGAVIACGGADLQQAEKMTDLDIQIFHGAVDPTVPVERSRNIYQALIRCGALNTTYHELMFVDHNSWTPAFNDNCTWDRLFKTCKASKKGK